jgi:hypothetical protein
LPLRGSDFSPNWENTFVERVHRTSLTEFDASERRTSPERGFGCRSGKKAAKTGYLRGAVAFGDRPHQLARRDRQGAQPCAGILGLKPAQGLSCALLRNLTLKAGRHARRTEWIPISAMSTAPAV